MEKKDNSSKQILLSVLGVAILVVAVVGVSFAAFTFVGIDNDTAKENKITTGSITMTYSETSDGISLTNAMPMSDDAGMDLVDTPNESGNYTTKNTFRFTVSANIAGDATINYEIVAIKKAIAENALANEDVKLYLASIGSDGNETQVMAPANYATRAAASTLGAPDESMVLHSGSFTGTINQTDQYVLKMWVDGDYVIPNGEPAKSFAVTVNVYANQAA